jgi:hypothetical protein
MATVEAMCNYVDARDSKWYAAWCARDGDLSELVKRYLELGGEQ